jgi:4-alpha-glucanotransferase
MEFRTSAADQWGIADRHQDAQGRWHTLSRRRRTKLMDAMRARDSDPHTDRSPSLQLLKVGHGLTLDEPVELTLEDGSRMEVAQRLPRSLPVGYHEFRSIKNGHLTRLIISPGCCHLPPDLRAWGWAVQVYALRSKHSWGIGDFADLRRFGRWSTQKLGAGFVGINPLGAATPCLPQEKSPYFPSSRRFRNPLYLRIEAIPGAGALKAGLEVIACQGRALNCLPKIDRDQVFKLKLRALSQLWRRFERSPAYHRYCATEGIALDRFAAFCVLAEHHGADWRQWPLSLRKPDSPAVRDSIAAHQNRVEFHKWLQWLLDRQLGLAAQSACLINDLPVGIDPAGADAWAWQDLLALDMSVGAPPDLFNEDGQDWGLAPFIPHRLRTCGYEPFIQTIRSAMRHAWGLRIDHVMGLFRLFWIPRGVNPSAGTYVRFRAGELLAIVAIESQRAQAVVIGEDLGTVEPGVRGELQRRKILGYRLLLAESKSPLKYPRQCMAAGTTHDLPTIAGLWSGRDLIDQKKCGLNPNLSETGRTLKRLQKKLGLPPRSSPQEAILRSCDLLARSPAMLMTAGLEDVLGIEERVNIPGTTIQRANWSVALPVPLEKLETHAMAQAISGVARNRRKTKCRPT